MSPPSLAQARLAALSAIAIIFPGKIIQSTDHAVTYSPTSSWDILSTQGSTGCGSQFLLGPRDNGTVNFVFPQPSTTFQWWGYQRSDGGLAQLCIDDSCQQVSYYNASTDGTESPRLLSSITGLSNTVHTLTITNLQDPAVTNFGQLTVDHFVVDGPPNISARVRASAPTFAADTEITTLPLNFSYHVPLVLGGHQPPVNVLLDAGATNAWVVSTFCTETSCLGHNEYVPSAKFVNLNRTDTLAYGDGGPDATFVTLRVNDSLSFGSLSIPQTTFGAAAQIPSGQDLDGNFGIAKAYYSQCGSTGTYPNFIENMYLQGIIKNPVIAFYQLDGTEGVPQGVISQGTLGGLDANKFTGAVDWIPIGAQSMWTNPASTRFVQASSSSSVINATAQFSHPAITFDTGDPNLLGLPHDDWLVLMNLLGAQGPDSAGNYLIPCGSQMTWNFAGTEGRNYTFSLIQDGTNDGTGFCQPAANDAGDTTNWITGVPFLDQYYIAFHYEANTMGFATRNLGASAASSAPFIG
ncbi:acid protease [Dacryopinax primogenitus]|uniref:Acid protease n=1 Tax=Dacryopinax primogenitus (strain DJM 731) TaxID=1858805 RepID=M5G2S0_DACPD|nr:acid protease [Dacryopinax primogenitus]EJU04521.1 acid protease [Dacryopinax primogenitus]